MVTVTSGGRVASPTLRAPAKKVTLVQPMPVKFSIVVVEFRSCDGRIAEDSTVKFDKSRMWKRLIDIQHMNEGHSIIRFTKER